MAIPKKCPNLCANKDKECMHCLGGSHFERNNQAILRILEICKRKNESLCGVGQWATESGLDRVAHGVPDRVDRIRCLGNAVVPQVAEVFGTAMRMVMTRHPLSSKSA